jgi:hypothetical protein
MTDDLEYYLDTNGVPTERRVINGQEIVVHYGDIPETDITTFRGIRVTTPIRTVIDIAADLDGADLKHMIKDCLRRRLFTKEDAMARLAQADLATHRGANFVRRALLDIEARG